MSTKFSPEEAKILRSIMIRPSFRNAQTPYEKVRILTNSENKIPIQIACKAVGISTRTYYNHKDDMEPIDPNFQKNAPNQLLNEGEENLIIQMIFHAQQNCNCLRGRDVKIKAQDLYHERTGEQREFGRDWFHRFLARHQDDIGKVKTASVDEDRGNISIEKVNEYIDAVLDALPKIKDLRLVLNMDECGFGKRPDYKKRRNCVFHKKCKVQPVWRAETDIYHISWICCVSAACTFTRHMFVSTRKHMDPDFNSTFLPNFGEFVSSPKGYLVQDNMIKWVQEILIPYVLQIREEINQKDHPVILFFDNLYQHLSDPVIKELELIQPIILIPLPPHSSHLTQPCDACIFGSAKSRFSQLTSPHYTSKFTSKLVRIKKSIQQTLNDELIYASWLHCGFEITINEGICDHISLSEKFQETLRQTATRKMDGKNDENYEID